MSLEKIIPPGAAAAAAAAANQAGQVNQFISDHRRATFPEHVFLNKI